MEAIAQSILNGLLMGGIYALISVGLTLVFGVMHIINFSHGEFLMLAMYATYFFGTQWGFDPYLTILLVVPILFVLGLLAGRWVIRPVVGTHVINPVLVTAGLGLFLQNLALSLWSGDFRNLDTPYAQAKFDLGPLYLSVPRLVAFAVAVAVSIGMYYLLRSTQFGRNIRAVAQEPLAAALMGIDVPRVHLFTFALGCAFLGVAGPLLTPIYFVSPYAGQFLIVTCFVVVVLGGMGNFLGSVLGGLIIGVAEALGGLYMPGSLAPVVGFSIMILILLFRPQGLLRGAKT